MSGETARHRTVVRDLEGAYPSTSGGTTLALAVAYAHRPTHPTETPTVWFCGEVWCSKPWPCLPFELAEAIAVGRPS